jgi:hypothetical protein
MIVLVSIKVCQQFLKFQNPLFKSYDFSNMGAHDVKPVSLIWWMLLQTAGPYSGLLVNAKKDYICLRTVQLTIKQNKKIQSLTSY